ncbi:guanylate kinase [Clostridia bacterium]|nr:guanylate kinase [Clostridia bacterium]
MSGFLLIVSGPSGVGKGTVINRVLERGKLPCMLSVSATTRAPRAGEADGAHYHFTTRENFEKLSFLEYAEYAGNLYGTPAAPVRDCIDKGICAILDIEVQGMRQVREKLDAVVTVFIAPPSWAELERRLTDRGTENAERIARRLEIARGECERICEYDYRVVNHNVDQAADDLSAIIQAEFLKTFRIGEKQL